MTFTYMLSEHDYPFQCPLLNLERTCTWKYCYRCSIAPLRNRILHRECVFVREWVAGKWLQVGAEPVDKMSAVWKYFELESKSSPTATCNIYSTAAERGGNKRAALITTHLIQHKKNQHSKLYEFTREYRQRHQSNKQADTFKRIEKYPQDSDMSKNITKKLNE